MCATAFPLKAFQQSSERPNPRGCDGRNNLREVFLGGPKIGGGLVLLSKTKENFGIGPLAVASYWMVAVISWWVLSDDTASHLYGAPSHCMHQAQTSSHGQPVSGAHILAQGRASKFVHINFFPYLNSSSRGSARVHGALDRSVLSFFPNARGILWFSV